MATENTKVTKRDNYNTLRDLVLAQGYDNELEDQLISFIDHELELMAQRAEKSKQYQKAHKASDDAMTDMICDVLTNANEALTVPDIVAKIVDSTPQKVVYRLGKLFKDGKIVKDTKSIKVEGSPARKVTFYAIAQ